jgi:hypothetical protein
VVDRAGALVWPKSFAFEAVKLEGRGEGESGDARR